MQTRSRAPPKARPKWKTPVLELGEGLTLPATAAYRAVSDSDRPWAQGINFSKHRGRTLGAHPNKRIEFLPHPGAAIDRP